jgi:membrane protein DedA with SNARE-associated domain
VGRLIWTSAYLGLGYAFGAGIEAAAEFPSSLSGLLVSLVVLAALGFMIQRNHARLPAAPVLSD